MGCAASIERNPTRRSVHIPYYVPVNSKPNISSHSGRKSRHDPRTRNVIPNVNGIQCPDTGTYAMPRKTNLRQNLHINQRGVAQQEIHINKRGSLENIQIYQQGVCEQDIIIQQPKRTQLGNLQQNSQHPERRNHQAQSRNRTKSFIEPGSRSGGYENSGLDLRSSLYDIRESDLHFTDYSATIVCRCQGAAAHEDFIPVNDPDILAIALASMRRSGRMAYSVT